MIRACVVVGGMLVLGSAIHGAEPLVVSAVTTTVPLSNYDDAPATPDADDPAIWVNRRHPGGSLVIGTAKDAGLLVYDLNGELVQALLPPNAPSVLPADPPTPAGLNLAAGNPCVESESGDTYGRFNNVDIAYDVPLGRGRAPRIDVAVVSDRGCDRVRFYRIDPSNPSAPLSDITAPDVARVFPQRYEQPSALQPSGAVEGWRDNPLDDQNTVYGLTVSQAGDGRLFVTQRERGLIRELQMIVTPTGRLTYQMARTLLFRTSFELRNAHGEIYEWTPCREAALEEPQSEGLVFDHHTDALFVAFETIGLYRIPLSESVPSFAVVDADALIEPLRTFGRSYRATPDDDEFSCEYEPTGEPALEDVVADGSPDNAGQFLEPDLEGLSIIAARQGKTILLASSQGDSSFHIYDVTRQRARHRGVFFIDGVAETDGVHYVSAALTEQFPQGLLIAQNGDAPEPPHTGDINGYEFDGSTQFVFVDPSAVLAAFPR